MVDPVIDEHFRRSLGADYMNLFGKRLNQLKSTSPASTIVRKSPQISQSAAQLSAHEDSNSSQEIHRPDIENSSAISKRDSVNETVVDENVEMSVDDHFAKALGDTWKQLQQNKSRASPIEPDHDEIDVNSDSMNDSIEKDDERSSPILDPKHSSSSES